MKKLLCFCFGMLVATVGVRATPLFSDTFTYPDGNLIGQGGWQLTGTSVLNPIQVTSGMAIMTTTGQDANSPISSYTLVDGSSIYFGATINVQSAQTGDYFLHWAPTPTSTAFMSRLFIKSTVGGFNVGLINSSGGTQTYGTSVFSFNTDYRVVVSYDSVVGALNDTGNVWVNSNLEVPNNPWGPASNPEPTTLGAINLRQGSGTAAPGLKVDDLNVATTFAEAATFTAVPEPTSLSILGGFGLLALLISRRRK